MATKVPTNTSGVQGLKVVPNPNQGDVQLPTQPQPVAQTMSYTPVNAQVWDENKTPEEQQKANAQQVALQSEWLQSSGVANQDIKDIHTQYADTYNGAGGGSQNSTTGFYTQDYNQAMNSQNLYGATVTPTTYNGQSGWYYVTGGSRTAQAGTSQADEYHMSDGDYAIIQQLKAEWSEYDTLYKTYLAQGDTENANKYKALRDECHTKAERIRAGYGYTGGTDGSQYLTNGATGLNEDSLVNSYTTNKNTNSYGTLASGSAGLTPGSGLTSGESVPGGSLSGDLNSYLDKWQGTVPDADAKKAELSSLLEEWKASALEQSNGQIDYAVSRAITELERALEDAQPQFKEQQEAVAKDEMQALDNSALYAEVRGDKGGIGQSQYNEIQAAAAQNRLAVQQAQTKLSTDTARQIADLRAQGEFEKADKALEISQQYLSQLISLEQWAAEYGLSAAQFQASLDQWALEYDLAMQQFQVSVDQWNKEYDLAVKQYESGLDQWNQQFQVDTDLAYAQLTGQLSDGTLTLSGQSQLAAMGEALLSDGIMPSADQLAAMGMTEAQAQQYITAQRLAAASASSSGSGKLTSDDEGSDAGVWSTISGMTDRNEVVRYLLTADLTVAAREQWLEQWDNAQPSTEPVIEVENDGVITENTVAWAKKVLSAQGGDVDALAAALEKRGFSEADILQILRELGIAVTLN